MDTRERNLKGQMKYANKLGAKFSMILGDSELEQGKANLKKMDDGTVSEISLKNAEEMLAVIYAAKLSDVAESLSL